jgi:Mg2+/citrate symporter
MSLIEEKCQSIVGLNLTSLFAFLFYDVVINSLLFVPLVSKTYSILKIIKNVRNILTIQNCLRTIYK